LREDGTISQTSKAMEMVAATAVDARLAGDASWSHCRNSANGPVTVAAEAS